MIDQAVFKRLICNYGTPLYVYDLDSVACRCSELLRAAPFADRILYAVKANPLPAIIKQVASEGLGAEVSSGGELTLALAHGIPPDRILYTGPCKTPSELSEAIGGGVVWFSVETQADWQRISEALAASKRTASALIRVNFDSAEQAGLHMVGPGSQFGFSQEDLATVVPSLGQRVLRICGVHLYGGTQVPSSATVALRTLERARHLARFLRLTSPVLNLGGGFSWPFAQPGLGPSVAPLAELPVPSSPPDGTIWFESGRYVAASSGTLVLTVMDKKNGRDGRTQVMLDGGINVLSGMSGIGRVLRPELSAAILDHDDDRIEEVDLYGPLCTPVDRLARGVKLSPSLATGDALLIANVGAYALTASLGAFLSRRPPFEVVLRGGDVVAAYRLCHGHQKEALVS